MTVRTTTLKGGDAAFPNAELVVNETDRTFWSDESNFSGAGDMVQGFAETKQLQSDEYESPCDCQFVLLSLEAAPNERV